MTRFGHSFERKAILEWIQDKGTCPLTRRPLRLSDLVPNRALEGRIQAWNKVVHDDDDSTRDSSVRVDELLVVETTALSDKGTCPLPRTRRSDSPRSTRRRQERSLRGIFRLRL